MKNSAFTLTALIGLLAFSPAYAELDSVLGNAGQVYEVRAGNHGDLFPGDDSVPPQSPILALETIWPDGSIERTLVPETAGRYVDELVHLLYERKSGALILVWESLAVDDHDVTNLASYTDGRFSEVYPIHEKPAASLQSPIMAVSQDTYQVDFDGHQLSTDRSIFHLVWQERQASGWDVYYTPVVLVEGQYVGWSGTFSLTEIYANIRDQGDEGQGANTGPGSPPISPELESALTVAAARDGRSIHATFVHSDSRRLVTLKVGILPLELAFLSDAVRDQLLLRAGEFDPDNISAFADGMRAQIISMGADFGFNPEIVEYVADQASDWLLESGAQYTPETIDELAEALREHTVDVTVSLFGSGASSDGSQIIEIDIGDLLGEGPGGPAAQPSQILDLRTIADLPLPAASPGQTAVYSADDGHHTIVAWLDAAIAKVFYVESIDGVYWSDPRFLTLRGDLDIEQIDLLLLQRVQ